MRIVIGDTADFTSRRIYASNCAARITVDELYYCAGNLICRCR